LSTGIARHGGFSGLIIIAPCSRGQSWSNKMPKL
jgi:hypothetical protein